MEYQNNDDFYKKHCNYDRLKKYRERKCIGLCYNSIPGSSFSSVQLWDERQGLSVGEDPYTKSLVEFQQNGFCDYILDMDEQIVKPLKVLKFLGQYTDDNIMFDEVTDKPDKQTLYEGLRDGKLMVNRFSINPKADNRQITGEIKKIVHAFVTAMNSKAYETNSDNNKDLRDFCLQLSSFRRAGFLPELADGDKGNLYFINKNPKEKIEEKELFEKLGLNYKLLTDINMGNGLKTPTTAETDVTQGV
jgi:hypothetical protein